jgi:hypothetical protein
MSPEEWLASQPKSAPVANQPMSPEQFIASQQKPEMGFFEGIVEQVTGTQRATPETQTLPEWTSMPELGSMSVASFKTALGTLLSNPKETVQILQSNYPDVAVRQDAKGNYILKSSIDQKEYAIPPGFSMGDIPRALGGLLAFTPAGRATTIPGAIAGGAATQTAIEATQAMTGGGTGMQEVKEIALAGATGPLGQIIQRAVPPVVSAVKQGAQRLTTPTQVATKVEPTMGAGMVEPLPPAGTVTPTPPVTPPVTPLATPVGTVTIEGITEQEIGNLVKRASGTGAGSKTAKDQLADLAQVNIGAKEAADRLGITLPADVFSDNPQVRAAAGLTRSVAGGEPEAAWRNTVSTAVDRADDVIKQFDATFVEGTIAPGAVSQKIKDSLIGQKKVLADEADKLYTGANNQIKKEMIVGLPKLRETLEAVEKEVTKEGMSATEKNLLKMVTEGKATYGQLMREKSLIGKALKSQESPYGSMAEADLKRLYAALSEDQLTNAFNVGGDTLRKELRAANLLYAKERALGQRIVTAFGEDIEGSIANKMRTAITSASKGDTGDFNRLLKAVPEDLRKETIATALASVTRSTRGAEKGGFGFSEFADIYPKLRANPPVYKTIVDTLGKESADVLRDLFEVSKRVTDARANVLTTGKANQALLQGMQAENLLGKLMESTIAKGTVVAATAMGGPVLAGGTSMIMTALTQGNKDGVKAAGKLFADEGFQNLLVESATRGTPSKATITKAANSQSFKRFADAVKLPKQVDQRIQYLESALQSGRNIEENQ